MCHNCDTMCRTKKSYTELQIDGFLRPWVYTKFEVLNLKRCRSGASSTEDIHNDVNHVLHQFYGKMCGGNKISKRISGANYIIYMFGKFEPNPKVSFRETTWVPQWRHNVSDKKSYTEVHIRRLLRGDMQNLGVLISQRCGEKSGENKTKAVYWRK